MGTVAIIQARMSSSRLPGKVLRPLLNRPVLEWVVRAAREADCFDDVAVATSTDPSDDRLAEWCTSASVTLVRGPLIDVVERYVLAAEQTNATTVVRLTGDCPLLDPVVIRMAVAAFHVGDVDHLGTLAPRSLPRGMDVEVVSRTALERANEQAAGADRVHVTSWLYRMPGRARLASLVFAPDASGCRVTLDTEEDGLVIDAVAAGLGDRPPGWREVHEWLRGHPEVAAINADVQQKDIDEA